MQSELTLTDVLSDPMIALLREADGISAAEFARFLTAASHDLIKSSQPVAGIACVAAPKSQPAPNALTEFKVEPSPAMVPLGIMPRASEPCLFC